MSLKPASGRILPGYVPRPILVWLLTASLALPGIACSTGAVGSDPTGGAAAAGSNGAAGRGAPATPDPQGGSGGGQAGAGGASRVDENSGTAGSTGASPPADAGGPSGAEEGADAAAPGSNPTETPDPMPRFTFFTTSQEGLLSLAPDKENGFGGDLGGLAGADEICRTLARRSNPGDRKVWRAFLSVRNGPDGAPVHAIDRIGKGPWHDYNEHLLAENIEGLLPGPNERPNGADPQLAAMFTDERGSPVSPDTGVVDNHDMLTGSDKMGRLSGDTCQDWTSAEANGNGRPLIGHAWPRSSRSGRHWISEHQAGGCAPGVDTRKIASNGTRTVGAGGGYGGFYCFAVTSDDSSSSAN